MSLQSSESQSTGSFSVWLRAVDEPGYSLSFQAPVKISVSYCNLAAGLICNQAFQSGTLFF